MNYFANSPFGVGYNKGEGRFSFTFLRREISPAKDEQQSCYIYDKCKVKTIF
jgi:hypothetical protein